MMRGSNKMAQQKPTSKRSSQAGKTKAERLRLDEHASPEAHSELARSEELWRSVFENSVIGVALTDVNGQFIAANPAYQAMLGYNEEELRHLRFLDITLEEYRDQNWALVEELLAGKRRQFQIEKQYRRKNGSLVWVRNSVSLVPGTERVPQFIMALSEDITESKRSEEALQTSQIKLWQVIDTIPALAWCNLPDGPNEFFSKRRHEYTGLSPGESHGWGWQIAFHPEDLPPLMKRWQEMLVSGEPGEMEARIRRHDGVYRWFLIRAEPFRDEAGQIHRWYGTSTDIEDRKRAEEQLRRGEAFLVEGQRLSRTGTFSWNLETGEIRWSEELYRIFDFAPDLPITLELIGSRVHPEDLPIMGEMIDRAKRGDEQFEYEHRIVMPDGSTKYIHLIGHAVRDAEGHVEYFGAAHDMTQRRIAEQALETSERNLSMIINAIPALAWSARPDGSAEFFNQRWLDYTGLPSKQAEGWGWTAVIHANDLDRMVSYWQAAVAAGQLVEIEGRLRRFDGAYRWFLNRAEPFRDESGQIVRWYGTSTDIEDRKQAEEQVQQSQAFLAEGQRLSRTGTFSWRMDTNDITWSEELYRIYGIEPSVPANLDLARARVHPHDLRKFNDVAARGLEDGAVFEHEYRLLMPDCSVKYLHVTLHAIRDKDGRPECIGAAQDITQRRITEQALEASERNLSMIINTIPALAWSARPDGAAEFFNQRWLDYTGLSAEQSRGRGWMVAIHPDDAKAISDHLQSSLASDRSAEVEARICRVDGAYRWFLFRTDPLRDESSNVIKWYGTITDIEDHKRLEETLRANELSLRQIVDNIPGFVHTTSAMGDVEFISHQTLEYFGKTKEELKDWSRVGIVHPDDLPHAIEAWRKSIETGLDHEVEQRNRRADGVFRWFQARGRAVRNEKGEITAWYWLLIDIDDRKKAEEALQSNERNLGLIINTMPTLAWSARPDGSAEFMNQHYLDYVGLPLEKLQGWGWTVAVHPEDRNGLSGAWQSIMATGKPGEAEARLRRFDGEYRWFLFRTNPMRDESGQIVKWYGTNTDIHDRKRAEAEVKESYLRLSEAQQLSKTGSFITDLVADEHNWSEETFRIFEFDPGTKVTVQMIRGRIHPEDLPSFDSMIGRAMTGENVDFSFRFVTSRDAVKHIRGMARVIEQIAGRPLFIGALQDVTESKVAEEALNLARSELAHVSRVTTLNALTASIAHEINQPLSGIITNANTCLWLLSSDPPDIDGARETAQLTIRDGNRASDVIERLRTLYSKKESRPETLDLNEATREVVALSLSDLQRNRVIVRHELADDLPPVIGDRVQLQQVVLNLVRNASEAMSTIEDRARELLIKTERERDNRVRLSVKDVGAGFQPQGADKLFEAFYTTKADGMGIGLHVSRSIIEAHHGRMSAIANDGPGATFSFSIPCKPGRSLPQRG